MIDSALLRGGCSLPGYHVRQLLGCGGFAEVWEAETSSGELVALKFLPCSNGRSVPEEIRSLQAIRQLSHPNLIHIENVICHRKHIVIVMERADGSLEDLFFHYQEELGRGMPAEHLVYLLAQAADALDFLNTKQHRLYNRHLAIQHCDVKPSNILLMGETVKLTDFGLSSWIGSHLTSHRRAGTLEYTAPEVFRGSLSRWTDQYALAVTYYQLRTGRLPFPETPANFEKSYVRPHPDLSGVSPSERAILSRALAPVPQDRWPTCTDMTDRLAAGLLR